jgi:hypothetical protein
MEGKTLLTSKTFWTNVVALVGMILTGSGTILEPQWLLYEAVALAVVNVGIRLYTGQPITGIVVLPEDGQ